MIARSLVAALIAFLAEPPPGWVTALGEEFPWNAT
jgi:hypothetical protein